VLQDVQDQNRREWLEIVKHCHVLANLEVGNIINSWTGNDVSAGILKSRSANNLGAGCSLVTDYWGLFEPD